MARDYAQIRTDIWGDDHWRTLTPGAQWLYELLLTSPTLSHAGVADWRPTRISRLARGLTPDVVRKYAAELSAGRFVLTDDDTEEVAVRSFLRHDGVLGNPNLWKSLGSAYADIYSIPIKSLVAREVSRLRFENPDGFVSARGSQVNPWESKYLQTLIKTGSDTPSDTPSPDVLGTGSGSGSTPTPAPTPTPEASLPGEEAKLKETRLPKDWTPSKAHIDTAKERGIDVMAEAEAFRLHAETHDRHAARWNSAFSTWLKKAKPAAKTSVPAGVSKADEWMYR